MNPAPLVEAAPQIQIHVAAVTLATLFGIVIFLNRKGTAFHKLMGWTYVTLMAVTAVSAIFIRRPGDGFPNIAGYTPIHLFVVLAAFALPMAIIHIKAGNVKQHAASMIGLFIGAIVIAGALAFMPGRIMHALAFGG